MDTHVLLMHSDDDYNKVKPINTIGKSLDVVNQIKSEWESKCPRQSFSILTIDPNKVLDFLIDFFD